MIDANDENPVNEPMDEYSVEVTELPPDPSIVVATMQINLLIVNPNNRHAQLWHQVEIYFIRMQKWMREIFFYIFLIFLGICIGNIYCIWKNPSLINKSLEVVEKPMLIPRNDTSQGYILEEQNVVFDSKTGHNNEFGVFIDDTINSPVKDDNKSYVKDILNTSSAITLVSGLTCTLYDAILYGVNQLFCWKDEIKNATPPEPPDDIYWFYGRFDKSILGPMNIIENNFSADRKGDESLFCLKQFFVDILNDEQSRQKSLMNEQVISGTASIDALFDPILKHEQEAVGENMVDYDEMIFPSYAMSMDFQKRRDHACPYEG